MYDYISISRYDIDNKLSVEHLRLSRIICFAMVVGVFLSLLIVLFLFATQKNINNLRMNESLVIIYSNIVLVLAFIGYSIFFVFPKFYLKPENIRRQLSRIIYDQNRKMIDNPIEKLIGFDRIYMFMRLAILEGISLFGIVVLFQAVTNGIIDDTPLLWLWIVPSFVLAIFAFKNYLRKESYVERIENQILIKLKRI